MLFCPRVISLTSVRPLTVGLEDGGESTPNLIPRNDGALVRRIFNNGDGNRKKNTDGSFA